MIYWEYYPKLDVHGETRDTVRFVVIDFIQDHLKMRKDVIVIIHGRNSHILKDEIHYLLKHHRNVETFHLVIENPGMTIVKLKK